MTLISLNGFCQSRSGVLITLNNDSIVTFGEVKIGFINYKYLDVDGNYSGIAIKKVKKFVRINEFTNSVSTDSKTNRAGIYLIKAGEHQTKAMVSRLLGLSAFVSGATLYELAKEHNVGYVITGITLGVGFTVASVVHQIIANRNIKKAGELLL